MSGLKELILEDALKIEGRLLPYLNGEYRHEEICHRTGVSPAALTELQQRFSDRIIVVQHE